MSGYHHSIFTLSMLKPFQVTVLSHSMQNDSFWPSYRIRIYFFNSEWLPMPNLGIFWSWHIHAACWTKSVSDFVSNMKLPLLLLMVPRPCKQHVMTIFLALDSSYVCDMDRQLVLEVQIMRRSALLKLYLIGVLYNGVYWYITDFVFLRFLWTLTRQQQCLHL